MDFLNAKYVPRIVKYNIQKPLQPSYNRYLEAGNQTRQKLGQFGIKQNALQLFPTWVSKTTEPTLTQSQLIANNMFQKNSPYMNQLANIYKITWSDARNQWQGQTINKALKKQYNKQKNNYSNSVRSTQLLNNALTNQQIVNQIPILIRQIVAANSNLANVGIGPKSSKGLPLYAGRFYNQKSKRVDLLPQASQLIVNPISKPQKLAYLQAKLINHWNQYVNMAQQYNKLVQTDPYAYRDRKMKAIQNGLKKGTQQQSYQSVKAFYMKCKRTVIKLFTGTLNGTSPLWLIFDGMAPQAKINLSQAISFDPPKQSDNIARQGMLQLLNVVYQIVKEAAGPIIATHRGGPLQKRLYNIIQQFNINSANRVIPSLINAYKAISIPNQISLAGVQKLTRTFKQDSKDLKQYFFLKNTDDPKLQSSIAAVQGKFTGPIQTLNTFQNKFDLQQGRKRYGFLVPRGKNQPYRINKPYAQKTYLGLLTQPNYNKSFKQIEVPQNYKVRFAENNNNIFGYNPLQYKAQLEDRGKMIAQVQKIDKQDIDQDQKVDKIRGVYKKIKKDKQANEYGNNRVIFPQSVVNRITNRLKKK